MSVGPVFGFLSGDSFQFFTLSACHQFVWILHDKMGQKSWKTHFVIFCLLYNKRKMETSAALGSIVP